MIINIHAGHNPDGKPACGAIGLVKESTEARRIKNEVIRQLAKKGHTIYDCTCDNGLNQSDVLHNIIAKCNTHKVDLDISIHLNAGADREKLDGKTTGTEVLIFSDNSKAKLKATMIAAHISHLGYKNRGVKVRGDLYFLHHSHAPALLIECFFVDDGDDVKLYNYKTMAKAIVDGILS